MLMDKYKAEGSAAFAAKDFPKAIELYSKVKIKKFACYSTERLGN